jgi:hypothetical protein
MRNAILAAVVFCGCGGGVPSGEADCGSHKDAAGCTADSACAVAGCPDCNGGTGFSVCYRKGSSPPDVLCPAIACAPLCASLVDAASCNARPDCHAVYQPMTACGCAAVGCCTFFSSCASGKPYCKNDQLTCRAAPPACEGPYVVAYANGCYEGCVLATACP